MKRKSVQIKEIISQLQDRGVKVSYRKRSDGGYIIKSINGVKFKGGEGNTYARQLTGNYLTKAQQKQRTKNIDTRVLSYNELDPDTKKALRRAQRAWREYKKAGGKQPRSRVTAAQVRRNVRKYGATKAQQMLFENEKYARGFAYTDNVEDLIARIERCIAEGAQWQDILDYLVTHKDRILEVEQRQRAVDILYDYQNRKIITLEEAGNALRRLFNLSIK